VQVADVPRSQLRTKVEVAELGLVGNIKRVRIADQSNIKQGYPSDIQPLLKQDSLGVVRTENHWVAGTKLVCARGNILLGSWGGHNLTPSYSILLRQGSKEAIDKFYERGRVRGMKRFHSQIGKNFPSWRLANIPNSHASCNSLTSNDGGLDKTGNVGNEVRSLLCRENFSRLLQGCRRGLGGAFGRTCLNNRLIGNRFRPVGLIFHSVGKILHPVSLILSLDREFVSVAAAQYHLDQCKNTNQRQHNGEDGDPNRGRGSSFGSLIYGALFFGWGCCWMWIAFQLADRPYGCHTWRSRLLYLSCGCLSVLCIGQGILLTFRFIVIRNNLHDHLFSYYTNYLANVLPGDKQIAVISALCQGSSIRSVERSTGVHRDTIMRLGVRVGHGRTALLDTKMRDLNCKRIEMDEIWGYVGKKDRHVRAGDDPQFGNVWTYCAIDADTKLVPAFRVAKDRDLSNTTAFVADVASRMRNRLQVSTDGLGAYVDAVNWAFGGQVDYGQIIKTYGTEESVEAQRRYSAPRIASAEKKAIFGRPDFDLISTSYVEPLNATTRLHVKRLARLTHAFRTLKRRLDCISPTTIS
jgi:hypothetical protein